MSRPSHQVSGVLCWLAGGNDTPYGRIRLSDSRSRGRAAQSSPSRSTSFHLRFLLVFYACEFVPTHNTYFHVNNKPFKPSPTPGPRRARARARPRWPDPRGHTHTPLTALFTVMCKNENSRSREVCARARPGARGPRSTLCECDCVDSLVSETSVVDCAVGASALSARVTTYVCVCVH